MQPDLLIDAAALSGRQQAFAYVASQCCAAQARCLLQIRESRAHDELGLSWEDFCTKHAGISRVQADNLIRRLEEFGESYFRLSELVRISPETYREIAPHIQNDVVEIDGMAFPLVPENAHRIRALIRTLHSRVRYAESKTHPSVSELIMRLDAVLNEVTRATRGTMSIDQFAAMRGLTDYANAKWKKLANFFNQAPTP